jgi:hypothetical protein
MLIYALLLTLALGGIDTAAHIAGLFAGVGLGFAFHFELRTLRLHRAMTVFAALMLLASVASVVLSVLATDSRMKERRIGSANIGSANDVGCGRSSC